MCSVFSTSLFRLIQTLISNIRQILPGNQTDSSRKSDILPGNLKFFQEIIFARHGFVGHGNKNDVNVVGLKVGYRGGHYHRILMAFARGFRTQF